LSTLVYPQHASHATTLPYTTLFRSEGRAVGQALALAHVLEVVGDHAGRVADHRVLDLADRLGGVVPGLVREVGVGGHAVDLDAALMDLVVIVGQVHELRRTTEGEVGRVEGAIRP